MDKLIKAESRYVMLRQKNGMISDRRIICRMPTQQGRQQTKTKRAGAELCQAQAQLGFVTC